MTRLFTRSDGYAHRCRLQIGSLDFFADPFPRADIIMLGMILHDWGAANKRLLIGKVCCGHLSSSPRNLRIYVPSCADLTQ
jgi:O-methyltransferase domain